MTALPQAGDAVWLLERANKAGRRIPILVLSDYDERQEAHVATAPFAARMLKPVDLDRLCGELVKALGRRA